MSSFLLNGIDTQKCFIIHKKDIEKRLDPFYYIPSIIELENKVNKLNPKPLRYYVKHISSGATPKTTETDRYYSDAENGVPFLRVQNLSSSGLLELDECKYINWKTHENYLKRSQVSGGDLLVKITGVGRMAVASVAPEGFVGNTNQHMVVIKTENKEASEILAAYLNTDIGEALASRRATGGTRPALDYPALLSIPIVYDKKILEIYKKAIKIKEDRESKAEDLLKSIDDYLLAELGITLPEKDNSLENRIFKVNFSEITGKRFEPFYNQSYFKQLEINLHKSKYNTIVLKEICDLFNGYAFKSSDYIEKSNTLNIRMSNIRPSNGFDPDYNVRYLPNEYAENLKHFLLYEGDIIIAMTDMASDPKILGVPTIVSNLKDRNFLLNQRVGKLFNIDTTKIQIEYLREILSSKLIKEYYNQQGARGVQINISREQILSATIPLPSLKIQDEIVRHIKSIRDKAKELQDEALEILENAKKEVEKMILGE